MRKAKPFLAVLAVECFTLKGNKVTWNQLEQFLMEKADFSKTEAALAIQNLVEDGMIIKDSDNRKGGKPNQASQSFRLFNIDEIEVFSQDYYCFECFSPGELIKCIRCSRVFHSSCVRRKPERPNYTMPPTNMIEEYQDESGSEVPRNSAPQNRTPSVNENVHIPSPNASSVPVNPITMVSPCCVVLVDIRRSVVDTTELKEEIEDKSLVEQKVELRDVICMGEVRPPTRQRTNVYVTSNSLKNETIISENDLETGVQLCTCCRLLETGQLTQPPKLFINEMHHLLSYGFKRCRSWIKREKNGHMDYLKLPKKYVSLIAKKLFHRLPLMTLDTMDEKIKNRKYKLLVEIVIDFLEYQFTIGVLFGKKSLKFDCSKYAIRDLLYEIAEIKRCHDCYRHSNERLTPLWFALPCVQRHELVFAKCTGHSYWPAKVVRVLQNAAKYDVRFFGGNHERSLIDSTNIRPIDSLNITFPKLLSFKKAMDELQCYQTLAQHSPTRFGYDASQNEIIEVIDSVMGAIVVDYEKPSHSGKRSKTPKKNTQNQNILFSSSMSENEAESEACSSSRSIQQSDQISTKRSRKSPPNLVRLENSSDVNSPATVISTPRTETPETSSSTITIEQHIAEMNGLRAHLCELHQRELAIAKRKSYCIKCLQPARFLCCIHAWYCSPVCQRQHWYEGHDKQCDNSSSSYNNS